MSNLQQMYIQRINLSRSSSVALLSMHFLIFKEANFISLLAFHNKKKKSQTENVKSALTEKILKKLLFDND